MSVRADAATTTASAFAASGTFLAASASSASGTARPGCPSARRALEGGDDVVLVRAPRHAPVRLHLSKRLLPALLSVQGHPEHLTRGRRTRSECLRLRRLTHCTARVAALEELDGPLEPRDRLIRLADSGNTANLSHDLARKGTTDRPRLSPAAGRTRV